MQEGGTVGFGRNQTGKIIGTRTIGNSSISINNVWLVDGLRHNLLSISKLFDSGYDVQEKQKVVCLLSEGSLSSISE